MAVELTWDGKYDADGKRKSPLKIALPFQTVETVNESVQDRQKNLFAAASRGEWRNRLIWGDKKYVLPSLLPEFAGKVNLIYIDPPFDTGANFSFNVEVEGESFTKEPSIIEQKAYRDTWGKGLDSYLEWFYETVVILRELLAETGSIYVHLDWHVGHYAKAVLDEVFGIDNFRNDIIWHYPGREMHISNKFNAKHDIILFYAKSDKVKIKMADVTTPYDKDERLKGLRRKVHKDEDGREWVWETRGQASGQEPYKRYVDEIISQGRPLSDVWDDLQFLRGNHPERVDYATQKPSWLIERIIKASSNEGDLVLDAFCGSGTTAAVAEKLNRKWITCDLGRFAIHTARKRLLGLEKGRGEKVNPFIVQNLGKYERQLWQKDEFGENASARIDAYNNFILELYNAQKLNDFAWLHGVKNNRVVHVGSVDSPVTLGDVKAIILEWKKNLSQAKSNGIDILGWEFALDLNETARQQAQEAGVDVKFVLIPREVLEKKAVEQGDIQFFELAAMFAKTEVKGKTLTVELENFIAPLDYVPQDIREKITKWASWIDYWSIDFDFKGDTFHNQWQSYRTRKDRKLDLDCKHIYEQSGAYQVQIKVIDILGNDTTKTVRIEVK